MPFDQFARRGHEATYGEKLPPDLAWDGALDVLVGQRVCLDGPTSIWQRLARSGKTMLVYEIDDDLLDVDPSNAQAYQFFDSAKRANIIANLTVADLVTVSTERLGEVAARYNPNVIVLPNCIPAWLTEHERPVGERTVIGWGGGSSHAADWAEAAPELRRFVGRTDDIELHTIGARYTQGWAGNVRHTGWQSTVDAYLKAIDFDIGLAPLRPNLFNRSKSALKALEYAALGIPAVVSDVGPYPGFVHHGQTGVVVRRPHEWSTALRDLVGDEAMRAELGRNARDLAKRACTIEDNAWRWETAYADARTGRAAA